MFFYYVHDIETGAACFVEKKLSARARRPGEMRRCDTNDGKKELAEDEKAKIIFSFIRNFLKAMQSKSRSKVCKN